VATTKKKPAEPTTALLASLTPAERETLASALGASELTVEQTALLDRLADPVAEEYLLNLTSPIALDMQAVERWLDVVYGLYDRKRPSRIEIVQSPEAALALSNSLTGQRDSDTDYCGVGEGGWVAFYDLFHRLAVLSNDEAADLLALRGFMRMSWDTILLDECAIVIRRPTSLRLDEAGNLHCAEGPCIEWGDGEKDYAWHGTWVDERVILRPRSFTRDEYLAIANTETRRALSEAGGWPWVAELLGAEDIDRWVDPGTELEYVLLRCRDGQTLLAKQSPALKDGSQPRYLEPVHEDLKTAQAARKWQAMPDWSVAQCEADPSLTYGLEA
jgi:hypothetical protein